MFCTFIFAVLFVKLRFPTVEQLRRYLAINILQSRFCLKFRCHGNKSRSG